MGNKWLVVVIQHIFRRLQGVRGGWIVVALWPVRCFGRHIDQVLDGLPRCSSCGAPVVAHGIVVGADDHVDAFGREANPRTLQYQRYEVLRHLFSSSEVNCGGSVPFFDSEAVYPSLIWRSNGIRWFPSRSCRVHQAICQAIHAQSLGGCDRTRTCVRSPFRRPRSLPGWSPLQCPTPRSR